jgi:hypothetical protein
LKQEKLKLGEILGSEESDNLDKSLAQIKAKYLAQVELVQGPSELQRLFENNQ